MNLVCSTDICPIILNSKCVFYRGDDLIYTGIVTNDNLETALVKINTALQASGIGYVFQNGIVNIGGNVVEFGGSLLHNTTISGVYTLTFVGNLKAASFITTGGLSSQFVKGDGSLDSTSYQPLGSYITALTGDGTASGPGSSVLTLATVNAGPGTYGDASNIPVVTVNGKGLVTSITTVGITVPSGSLSFTGDVTGSGVTGSPVTLTLATVNTNVFGTNTPLKFSVNGKGLITSAAILTALDLDGIYGYTPVDDSITLTINGTGYDLSTSRSWSVGTVTSVGASLPLSSSGGNTPNISISQATAITDGYLSFGDWNIFNNKQTAGNYITDLSGDVVANGPGAVSSSISNNVVTYAKMQNVSTTSRLLGSSSTTNPVQEISIGTGLTLSGTILSAPGSGGTVTTVSVVTNQGVSGSVANPTTTPAITISLGVLTGVTSYNGLIITADTGTITTGIWNATKISEGYGGTNQSTYLTGDTLYASAANTLSKLNIGTSAQLYIVNSGIPSWQTLSGDATISNVGALTLANTTVSANSYTVNGNAIFTVDSKGRLTSASNVTISIASLSPLTTKGDIFVYSTVNDRLPVATGDGKILQVSSGAATGLAYSTPTYPSGSGTSGKFLISDGTNNVYSTSTIPTSAGATALKHLKSDGTNYVLTTSTISDTPSTAGKLLISDGTNWVTSTSIFPNTIGIAGKILRSDGTINTYSTSTFSDTYTASNLLYSNGTNTVTGLATANSSILVTDGGGIPSLSTTIPNGVIATTQSASDNSTKVATTAYVDNQATLGNWRLASGGTLTGVNTIISNTANWLIFSSTYTATANNQFSTQTTGTITARNTASDTLIGDYFNRTLVSAAATQTLSAVVISPTFTDSNSATKYILRAQNATSDRFTLGFDGAVTITSGNSSTNPTIKTVGVGTTTNYTFRAFQSDGTTEIHSLQDSGLFVNTSKIQGSSIGGTWTATATNQSNLSFGGTFTGTSLNTDNLIGYQFNPALNAGTGNQSLQAVYINPTFGGSVSNTKIALQVLSSASFRINSVGAVGIGGSTISSSTTALFVTGLSGSSTPAAIIRGTGNSTTITLDIQASSTSSTFNILDNGRTTMVGRAAMVTAGASYFSMSPFAENNYKAIGLKFVGAAHTLSPDEQVDIYFNTARTVQFGLGNANATQRSFWIDVPTYSGASGAAVTSLYNAYIGGAPKVSGTNISPTTSAGLYIDTVNVTAQVTNSYGLYVNAQTGATNNYAAAFTGGIGFGIGTAAPTAYLHVLQAAQSSGWTSAHKITAGAHTALTTTTEFVSNDFVGATQTWVDGTTATQRFNYFRGYTVNKTTTSATFTDIYNVFIDKSIAGSGVTFTRNWGIGTDGNLQVQGNAYIGAASVAPTALLHLAAGTTSVAPARLTSGALTTGGNILAGNIEFLTDDFYATITTGTARKNITLWDTPGTSTRIPYATTNGRLIDDASLVYDTTNGIQTTKDIRITTAGKGIYIKEGTNARMGTGTLALGTATISTTAIGANTRVFAFDQGGIITNLGSLYEDKASRVNGTSFVIKSTNTLDASDFVWILFEPA